VTVTDRCARPIDLLHDELMARAQAEHAARTAADRAAASKVRAAALLEGAAALEALDPVEAALAGQHAWADAAALLRRLAGEAQQDECHCLDNPGLTEQIDYPVRCPHCPSGAGGVPPTHWTKHMQRHHPEATGRPAREAQQDEEPDDTLHACPGRWGGPDCRCFDDVPARAAQQDPTQDGEFVPPVALGLPAGTLEAAEIGANRLDAWARTPNGRNFLAHALVQLARTGWLRTEPGEGFEPVRDPEPQEPTAVARPGQPETEA
jgi:hypothetical protein